MPKREPTDELVTVHLQKLIDLSSKLIYKDTIRIEGIDWQEFSKALSSMVQVLPLHTVISLHFHKILQPLLKSVTLLWKSSKLQALSHRCVKQIQYIMQCIYENSYECFLKIEEKSDKQDYSTIINEMIKQKIIVADKNQEKGMLVKDPYTLTIRHLLGRLYALAEKRLSGQSHIARGEINYFIDKELLIEDPHCLLEEIVLNWVKQKTEAIQAEPKEYMCCKIHFEHLANSNMSGFSEGADQEFKDYWWPLQNQSIKSHLTKTIVGYLNTSGGIIYVGMKQDKFKMVEVKGIKLTDRQKLDFLYFIYDIILSGVYPKEPQRIEYEKEKNLLTQQQEKMKKDKKSEEEETKWRFKEESKLKKYPYINRLREQFTKSKKNGYEYRINKYITIDFLDVYDHKSNWNVLGEKGEKLYVVRIKVKVGDSKELYHIINKHDLPETYLREDKSVKKKTMVEFYKQFEDRMSGLKEKQRQNQKNEKHSYCRFQPLQNTYIKDKQEENNQVKF